MPLDQQHTCARLLPIQVAAQGQHGPGRQHVRGKLELVRCFTLCHLKPVGQLATISIDEDDILHLADQGGILDLQLVAILDPPIERGILLNSVEKRPAEAVILAAAVTNADQ